MNASARIAGVALIALAGSVLCSSDRSSAQEAVHFVDQREVCLTCHDLDGAFSAPVQHAPVVEAQCSACHNPHAARLGSLLRQRAALLCGECHEETLAAMDREHVHPPVAEGACSECHAPHASEHEGLLLDDRLELCSTCHEDITSWRRREVQHSPFRQGQCGRCHDPHASDLGALAVDEVSRMCSSCHPASAKFRADHGGFPVERAECQQCHDPHASPRPGLLRANLHAPFEMGDCDTCHAGADAAEPFQLVASQAELCGDCHDEQVERSRHAPFGHVSAGGGSCTECHNPHAGEGQALLHSTLASVCLSCHNPGGGASGVSGRFSTHADLDCVQCHEAHGGDRPVLLADPPIELCNECHGHQHNVSHPMGEGTRDQRNGTPLDCLSCHGIHHAPAEDYLHAPGEGELCVGCHKEVQY